MTDNDVAAPAMTISTEYAAAAIASTRVTPRDRGPQGRARPIRRVSMAGCPVDLCDAETVLGLVQTTLADPSRPALGVASANLDHIHHFGAGGRHRGMLSTNRDSFRWLTLLDGAPLVSRARRWSGYPHPRLAGSDLIGPLLDMASRDGRVVGFLGGAAEMLAVLRPQLAQDYPDLRVGGFWSPTRGELASPDANERLAGEVREAAVDMLVVGLGKPRQEMWIDKHAEDTGARVLLAFGASADFLAGKVPRAPQWIRDHGLEWAFRLAREPRRLGRRYLIQGPRAMQRLLMEPVVNLASDAATSRLSDDWVDTACPSAVPGDCSC